MAQPQQCQYNWHGAIDQYQEPASSPMEYGSLWPQNLLKAKAWIKQPMQACLALFYTALDSTNLTSHRAQLHKQRRWGQRSYTSIACRTLWAGKAPVQSPAGSAVAARLCSCAPPRRHRDPAPHFLSSIKPFILYDSVIMLFVVSLFEVLLLFTARLADVACFVALQF